MIVTSKKWFDTYCEWLFHIFLRCRSRSVWKMERTIITNGCLDLFRVPLRLCGCA
ncbi:MAG: hypothetical protein ACLVCH_02285 [Roseburia inulinivorans]